MTRPDTGRVTGAREKPTVSSYNSSRRLAAAACAGALALGSVLVAAPVGAQPDDPQLGTQQTNPGTPQPVTRSQRAFDPEQSNFAAKWTRNDARQIIGQSDLSAVGRQNSVPGTQVSPDIPVDFPDTNPDVWVWDTWTLTDARSDQISYKGWEVIFSLTADRHAGYSFDDRHWNARIGYFYRRAGVPASERPANGGWIYGGHLFPDGASPGTAEWSGSTRIFSGGKIKTFYTATTRSSSQIMLAEGQIQADDSGVRFTGFGPGTHTKLLEPDGVLYQTHAQNPDFAFRDPFTFRDPRYPGKTFMVFEGNNGGALGSHQCTESDLGYRPGDPNAETVAGVQAAGANRRTANVGLAVATNPDLTAWRLLPPILSANCVNDQTERPQIYLDNGRYYLFTISHQFTYAAGLRGPDGVYGFVGKGIRSDFQPLNRSGLVLGNPTNLNRPLNRPQEPVDPDQNPRQYQSYSHYVMPGGLVESFIDNVEGRRGGSLAPTVRLDIKGARTTVDRGYGQNGLGAYGDIPANRAFSDNRPASQW